MNRFLIIVLLAAAGVMPLRLHARKTVDKIPAAAAKNSNARANIDQSTKEALVLSFARAISSADVDSMWMIITPQLRKKILTVCPWENIAKALLLKKMTAKESDDKRKKITAALKSAEGRKMLIDSAIARDPEAYVKIDNKWYVDLEKIGSVPAPRITDPYQKQRD